MDVIEDNNMLNILKSIKIAKILKEEDKKISRLKKGLSQDLNSEAIKEYYLKENIELLRYDEWIDNI